MHTREIGLLIAVAVYLVLIVVTVKKLNTLEDKQEISKGKKDTLIAVTVLIPLLGFILTYIHKKRINENIA